MATKIFDFEFPNLPEEIVNLEAYDHILALIRLYGRPVSQVRIPVKDGRVDSSELRESVSQSLDWNFWHHWLKHYLSNQAEHIFSQTSGKVAGDENLFPHLFSSAQPFEMSFRTKSDHRLCEPVLVAVCTRDRPEDLFRCLQALKALPERGQEIIVIDSCSSTPATKEVVARFEGIRYVRENLPGLNRARNRALREAKSGIVVFSDDDAVVDPGWLDALLGNFYDPLVFCVTGLTMPFELETEAQETFERYSSFNRGFTRRVYDSHSISPFLAGHAGAGANMALRREVLELVGPFDAALDAGTPTHSGGDNEMFSRILASGYKIVYEPGALSWHRHRRSWQELRKTIFGYGVGIYAAWTRSLLVEREFTVFLAALSWIVFGQLPALISSFSHRPESKPLRLLVDELIGCLVGPWAYLYSRFQINR